MAAKESQELEQETEARPRPMTTKKQVKRAFLDLLKSKAFKCESCKTELIALCKDTKHGLEFGGIDEPLSFRVNAMHIVYKEEEHD